MRRASVPTAFLGLFLVLAAPRGALASSSPSIDETVSDDQKKHQMQIHFLLASEYFKEGEYDAAIREWKEVLKLDPEHALSREKIKRAEEKRRRLAER